VTPATEAPSKPGAAQFLHRFLFLCLLACLTAWLGSLLHFPLMGSARWAEALFPIFALATTLTAMARSLPAQNVLLATTLIAVISGIVEFISVKTGIPFGPLVYTEKFGPQLFGTLPWPIPFIWVVTILNSRGVARLILRPWRKMGKYGFWVIGATCLLCVILDFGLEPFATTVNRYWIWHAPDSVPAWYTAPWVTFVAWATTTLLILAFTTPWLINKRHIKNAPPDYHPLIIWLLLNLLLAVGDATHHLWWAAGFSVAASIVITIFACRGARW